MPANSLGILQIDIDNWRSLSLSHKDVYGRELSHYVPLLPCRSLHSRQTTAVCQYKINQTATPLAQSFCNRVGG